MDVFLRGYSDIFSIKKEEMNSFVIDSGQKAPDCQGQAVINLSGTRDCQHVNGKVWRTVIIIDAITNHTDAPNAVVDTHKDNTLQ